jgi:hypothetical protein|tara:strand:- start:405 stop:761 length:357 start_codon:yes stop_codon:yes gene_type:complete
MNELPDELVYEIISYNETYNTKFNEINKKCRTIFNKNKYKIYVYKIIKWYKKNTFNFKLQLFLNKMYFIKFFRKYYSIDNFRIFPEFFIKKMKRKKVNLIKFICHPDITLEDLCKVGW